MAGHNKWSKIKRLKEALDLKRGTLFSRLSQEIVVAARLGGGHPSAHPRLCAAVQAACTQSMSYAPIDRAFYQGAGEIAAHSGELLGHPCIPTPLSA